MVRKDGRARRPRDRHRGQDRLDNVSGAKRKAGAAEEKKPRRNPRPSRAARGLAAKGVYE
jgi:hypothetical protein